MGDFHYYQAMDEQIEWFASGDRDEPGEHSFAPDPLYYHMKINYELITENDIFVHANVKDDFDLQIPKKIIKKRTDTTMYVHTQIFKKILIQRQTELKKQRRIHA